MAKESEKGRMQVWVHPLYAKKLKFDAAVDNKSILEHTRERGLEHERFLNEIARKKNDDEKKRFSFRM